MLRKECNLFKFSKNESSVFVRVKNIVKMEGIALSDTEIRKALEYFEYDIRATLNFLDVFRTQKSSFDQFLSSCDFFNDKYQNYFQSLSKIFF